MHALQKRGRPTPPPYGSPLRAQGTSRLETRFPLRQRGEPLRRRATVNSALAISIKSFL